MEPQQPPSAPIETQAAPAPKQSVFHKPINFVYAAFVVTVIAAGSALFVLRQNESIQSAWDTTLVMKPSSSVHSADLTSYSYGGVTLTLVEQYGHDNQVSQGQIYSSYKGTSQKMINLDSSLILPGTSLQKTSDPKVIVFHEGTAMDAGPNVDDYINVPEQKVVQMTIGDGLGGRISIGDSNISFNLIEGSNCAVSAGEEKGKGSMTGVQIDDRYDYGYSGDDVPYTKLGMLTFPKPVPTVCHEADEVGDSGFDEYPAIDFKGISSDLSTAYFKSGSYNFSIDIVNKKIQFATMPTGVVLAASDTF